MIKKRLPPYGRLIRDKESPVRDVRIHIGHRAWKRAVNSESFLRIGIFQTVLPYDSRPDDIDWTICRNAGVVIFHDPESDAVDVNVLRELATLIVKAGAEMVIIADPDLTPMPVYKPRKAA